MIKELIQELKRAQERIEHLEFLLRNLGFEFEEEEKEESENEDD